MPKQNNVLFIIIDQLRADCIFGALADHIELPNLQALMQDATSFTQCYSVSNPCGPARASILTGQYAMNHGSIRNGTPLANGTPNLALEMRKAGYEPMLFGYTDTSLDPRFYHKNDPAIKTYEQVMQGFSEKLEMRFEESFPWRASLKAKGYELPDFEDFYIPKTPEGQQPQLNDPAFYKAQDSDTAFLTDKTLEALSVVEDKNWFSHVTYIRPHPPFVAPAPYHKMYDIASSPLPIRKADIAEEIAVHPYFTPYIEYFKNYKIINAPLCNTDNQDETFIRTARSLYFGLISEVDHHIGRIINQLKASGQYDNTLIVVQADHGEMLGDHHMWGKQTVYDAAFHVPLIIRDPHNTQMHGKSVDHFVESIDITPTILDWVGRNKPSSMNGNSLLPMLKDEEKPPHSRNHVYFEFDYGDADLPQNMNLHETNVAIIREKQYKLIHFNAGLPPLLFDMQADPNEMDNLANKPEFLAILLQMTQKLLNHRMRHRDHTLSDVKITEDAVVNYQYDD